MRKLVGQAIVILAISGCANNAPSPAALAAARAKAAAAQQEAAVAQVESDAKASCPTTALQVHVWANKARDAMRLQDADLLKVAQDALTSLSVLCKDEKDNPQGYAFDPAEVGKFKRHGAASLAGEASMRERGGNVATCAGQSIALLVETPYVDTVIPILLHGEPLPPNAAQHLIDSTVQGVTCDASGRFAFKGIVPGNYLLLTTITWTAEDKPQGRPMMQAVKVSSGHNEIRISQ